MLSPDKHSALLAFYNVTWNEMTWRRNAGYRTVIIGFGYFGLMVAYVASNHAIGENARYLLAGVVALGTLFGAGWLMSNYKKYMAAAAMTVKIEEYLGAYSPAFLGALGALMPADRKERPKVPLSKDVVCLWSVIAFLAGGLITAAAIVMSGPGRFS